MSDGDAACEGGAEVDVVVSDGDVADYAQPRRGVDQFGVDAVGEQADDAAGFGATAPQLVVGRRQIAGPDVDLGCLCQPAERVPGQGARYEHERAVRHHASGQCAWSGRLRRLHRGRGCVARATA